MNAFRTISHLLVASVVVIAGSAHAIIDQKSQKDLKQNFIRHVIPLLAREALKDQNPHVAAIVEGGVATLVNGHLLPKNSKETTALTQADYKDAAKYFVTNVSSRELAMAIAAYTRFNKKYLEACCDEYVGAVPYVGQAVSETIKKITPTIIETAHNSLAATVKAGQPAVEFTIRLI